MTWTCSAHRLHAWVLCCRVFQAFKKPYSQALTPNQHEIRVLGSGTNPRSCWSCCRELPWTLNLRPSASAELLVCDASRVRLAKSSRCSYFFLHPVLSCSETLHPRLWGVVWPLRKLSPCLCLVLLTWRSEKSCVYNIQYPPWWPLYKYTRIYLAFLGWFLRPQINGSPS